MTKMREIKMPAGKYDEKCPYAMPKPRYIVIHNTANDAKAENEIRYMQEREGEISFHFAVDDKEAVQGVPLDRNAWHASDGGQGEGNRYGIAIEICYSKSGGARFIKAEQNAAELTAYLMKKYSLGIDAVRTHQSFARDNKYCPHRTLDMGWDRFLGMVKAAYSGETAKKTYADNYNKNGVTYTRAKEFSIRYHDKDKRKGGVKRYINGGFFAYYSGADGAFTLPVGNLLCDIENVPVGAEKYIRAHVYGKRLNYPTTANAADSALKNKQPSTLLVGYDGKAEIKRTGVIPSGVKYAISGLPVIRDGRAVTMNEVTAEGWGTSSLYGTSRNLVGLRGGGIWIITLKTKTANYIKSGEIADKLRDEEFSDVIALDGGGSYIRVEGITRRSTGGSRAVNNIIVF